jgi:hypothetical protein
MKYNEIECPHLPEGYICATCVEREEERVRRSNRSFWIVVAVILALILIWSLANQPPGGGVDCIEVSEACEGVQP